MTRTGSPRQIGVSQAAAGITHVFTPLGWPRGSPFESESYVTCMPRAAVGPEPRFLSVVRGIGAETASAMEGRRHLTALITTTRLEF
jgi:hypothetical protein